MDELLKIIAMLRDKEHGCPWDAKQTFKSIAPHTLEEVYEVVDTLERADYSHLANELGDLLFQIVFYAQLGKEAGIFDFDVIVNEITQKLLTRHPHVFPDATIESFGVQAKLSPEQVEGKWEEIKTEERQDKAGADVSILADIPKAFPAITRARKIQKRVASVGCDWPDSSGVLEKVEEESVELKEAISSGATAAIEEELGDLFFSLVNLARHLKVDPETSLRKANEKFEYRFRNLETRVNASGKSMDEHTLESLEDYWQAVKAETTN